MNEYLSLVQELEEVSIELRYTSCQESKLRLRKRRVELETLIQAYIDAEDDQDITPTDKETL